MLRSLPVRLPRCKLNIISKYKLHLTCKKYKCFRWLDARIVLVLFGDIRWRALDEQEAYRAENHSRTLSVARAFFLLPCTRIRSSLISLFLFHPLSVFRSPFFALRLSDKTHRSGTMVALYLTAALVEFGLAPAKRYSRCSRHVEFIVAVWSINRFRGIVPPWWWRLVGPPTESRGYARRRRDTSRWRRFSTIRWNWWKFVSKTRLSQIIRLVSLYFDKFTKEINSHSLFP